MRAVGDIHIYVTDFDAALGFYRDGLGLAVVEQELSASSPFAVLEFPDGGSAVRLLGGARAWPPETRPDVGEHPTIRFDVITDEFDTLLLRAAERGGMQIGDIETYDGMRVVTLADPDGNTFELIEVPGDDD